MSLELWRQVRGFSTYLISSEGRLKRVNYHTQTSNGQCRKYKGGIIATFSNQHGHKKAVMLGDDGKKVARYIHHLVAEEFIGERPKGMSVLHGPLGVRVNTPSNLSYGTLKKNSADMIRDGTHRFGDKHALAVLDWGKVREIRRRIADGERVKDLALEFGVSRQNITAIKVGRSWVE